MFLVPVADVEVKDTWHVDGMVATGSRDIVARSVAVPLDRVSSVPTGRVRAGDGVPAALPGAPVPVADRRPSPRRLRAARGAAVPQPHARADPVRHARSASPRRRPRRSGSATSTVRTAWPRRRCAPRHARWRRTPAARSSCRRSTRPRLRLTIAHVVRQCRDVVRDVIEASGAGAHYLDNELQRIHRDVHMIAAHTVFDIDAVGRRVRTGAAEGDAA